MLRIKNCGHSECGCCTTQRAENTQFTSLELHSYCPQVIATHDPQSRREGHPVSANHLERVRGSAGVIGGHRHLQRGQTKHQTTFNQISKYISAAEAVSTFIFCTNILPQVPQDQESGVTTPSIPLASGRENSHLSTVCCRRRRREIRAEFIPTPHGFPRSVAVRHIVRA